MEMERREGWFLWKTPRDDVQSSMKLWRDRENNKTYGSIQQNKNNFLWWFSNNSNNSRAELNNFADFRGISSELEISRLHCTAALDMINDILELKLEHLSAFIHRVDFIFQSSWYEYKWRQFQSIKDKLNPPTLILFCQNIFHYLQPPSTIEDKFPSSLCVCTRVTFEGFQNTTIGRHQES